MTERQSRQQAWRPAASLETMRRRARLLADIRGFFARRGVLEVETPILSSAGNPDPQIDQFTTDTDSRDPFPRYLQTSPEFPMKRLLAAGSGPIYQICKVFRRGESGRFHTPEFTLLEWYRPGFDHHQLMGEVETLLHHLLPELPLQKAEKIPYRDAFLHHLDIDPLKASPKMLRQVATRQGLGDLPQLDESDCNGWLDLLMTHCIQPRLGKGRLTFLYDYPATQAALARIIPTSPPVASRFELFLEGLELANGYHELTDADEQEKRFHHEGEQRRRIGLPTPPVDRRLLAALAHGLPASAGVALGLDRVLMLACGAAHIDQTLAIPFEQA